MATTVAICVNFTVHFSWGLKLHLFKLMRFSSTFWMGEMICESSGGFFSLRSLTNCLFPNDVYINICSSLYRLTWCMYVLFPCHWCKVEGLRLEKSGILFSPPPFYKLKEGLVLLIILPYYSKKHSGLVLDFHKNSSNFFSRWITSLLIGLNRCHNKLLDDHLRDLER